LRRFTAPHPRLVRIGVPEARRVRRVDLVDDDDPPLRRLAELVLRVDEDETALRAVLLTATEERHRHLGGVIEILGAHPRELQDLLARGGHVVCALCRFRARREQRPRQALVLPETVGQAVPTELAGAALVVHPDARRRRAGEVRAHDHLDGQRRAFAGDEHVRVGHGEHVVLRDVPRELEPERRREVENLSLERQRAEDAIERAHSIRDDEDAAAVRGGVVVPDLALVALAPRKIGAKQRERQGGLEHLGRGAGHGARTVSRRDGTRQAAGSRAAAHKPRSLAFTQNCPSPPGITWSAFGITLIQPGARSRTYASASGSMTPIGGSSSDARRRSGTSRATLMTRGSPRTARRAGTVPSAVCSVRGLLAGKASSSARCTQPSTMSSLRCSTWSHSPWRSLTKKSAPAPPSDARTSVITLRAEA